MPPQYIFHDRKSVQGLRQEGRPQEHLAVVLPGGQDRRASAATARARARCCGSWPGSTRTSSAPRGPRRGSSIGFVPQEPTLDPSLDVRGNVEQAVAPVAGAARPVRRDQRPARRGARRRRDGRAARRAGEGPGRHRGGRGLGPRPPDRDRHGRHAAAARRRRGRHPLRRRAAARGPLQDPAPAARPPAARRADQPPRRRERRLARTAPAGVSRAPSSLVTHDRYFLDNVAKWILELDRGQGIPWEGNYSSWLEQKQARLALEEKQESSRRKQLARELEWVRMSPRARVAKNRARLQRYEQLASQDAEKRDEADRAPDPARAAPGRPGRRGRGRRARATATGSCSRT